MRFCVYVNILLDDVENWKFNKLMFLSHGNFVIDEYWIGWLSGSDNLEELQSLQSWSLKMIELHFYCSQNAEKKRVKGSDLNNFFKISQLTESIILWILKLLGCIWLQNVRPTFLNTFSRKKFCLKPILCFIICFRKNQCF